MYLNADTFPQNTLIQDFDICIVGAGAAGLAMAKRLIGSSKRVLVLTTGAPTDRGLPTPVRQSIYRGTVGGLLHKVDPIFSHRSRLHMYGGTTNHFGFWARPLDPSDFTPRTGYRDAHWPFGLDELIPYYADAHHFGRFGPFNYDDMAFWQRVLYARPFSPLPDDPLQGAIMHAQYDESLHDFQVQFGDDLRAAENVTILFNANLVAIETTDDQAHVTALHCATIENGGAGRAFRVQASAYVLAMGGIENVRHLLLAGNLGDNRSGHLGRGFMMHPLVVNAARVRFAKPVESEVRNFFRDQQVRLQPPVQAGGDYLHMSAPLVNPEFIFDYCVFNAWGVLTPTEAAMDAARIGNFRLILRFDDSYDEAIININWEQIPNEDSTVRLNPSQTDPIFGHPVTHVDWRLREEDKRTLIGGLQVAEAYLRQHGAIDFQLITETTDDADEWCCEPHEGAMTTGDHHMGALRMAADPEGGIVDANSRFHSVDNLYAAGCAVFPTGGFANPTLTIVALALRLADHLDTLNS